MRGNVRRNTRPEVALRRELFGRGFRFRVDYPVQVSGASVRADLAFRGPRVAVFVDGCFWHGCPEHGTQPRTHAPYWAAKIERNKQRDTRQSAALTADGWLVVRVWEHEPPTDAAERIASAIVRRRR